MAAKKKGKKKKRTPVEKVRTARGTPKKSAKKKSSHGKMGAKRAAKPAGRIGTASRKRAGAKKRKLGPVLSAPRRAQTLSGDAASQGLSDVERADSKSVGELLDEGNTFEAGVVRGVEQAEDAEEREVRTREVPEDDVPEEYLDKD